MIEESKKNLTKHYLPLLAVLIFGFGGFVLFPYDKIFQFFILGLVALLYVVWGIMHHKIHGDIHPKIIVEYILIALLGMVIVYSLIFRA